MDEYHTIMNLFKQVDARASGMISFKDFSSYVMNIEVDELAPLTPAVSSDVRYHFSNLTDNQTYGTELVQLNYFPPPISRLCMFSRASENLELRVLPDGPTYAAEMPRVACKPISHHTYFKQHELLSAIQVDGEDIIISSSIMGDGASATLGGYINMWDVPTEVERREGTQYLADLKTRFQTEFPQHHLCWSAREEVLFSGSEVTGQLLCTRIKSMADNEDDGEEAVQEYKKASQEASRVAALQGDGDDRRRVVDDAPLSSDPADLRSLLDLRQRMRRNEKDREVGLKRKTEEKKEYERQTGLSENETNVFEAEAEAKRTSVLIRKRAKNQNVLPLTQQRKIRVHSIGISGILELRTTDGSNFLVIASRDGSIALLDLGKPYMESRVSRRCHLHLAPLLLLLFLLLTHL
jgi:hypothetical protein